MHASANGGDGIWEANRAGRVKRETPGYEGMELEGVYEATHEVLVISWLKLQLREVEAI